MNKGLDFTLESNRENIVDFTFSIPFWEQGIIPAARTMEKQQLTKTLNFKVLNYNIVDDTVTVSVLSYPRLAPDKLRELLISKALIAIRVKLHNDKIVVDKAKRAQICKSPYSFYKWYMGKM